MLSPHIPIDFTPYSYVNVIPYKKGLRERISRENIEDLYIPVIEDQLRRLARRMAYTIDLDCINVIGNAAGTSSAATGISMGSTGSPFTVSGALGSKDILWAKAKIESYNLIADTILLNPINLRDLEYLPQFSLWAHYGNAEGQGVGPSQSMLPPKPFGLNVFSSNVVSAGTAYILSTGQNLSAAYAPLGFFVIKRPLMSDVEIKKEFDSVDVTLLRDTRPL